MQCVARIRQRQLMVVICSVYPFSAHLFNQLRDTQDTNFTASLPGQPG